MRSRRSRLQTVYCDRRTDWGNQSVQEHLENSTSYLWKIADTSTTFGTWEKFARRKNEKRWSTLISLSIWLTTMVICATDNKPAPLIESRLAALVAPARYHLHLDRAIFQLQLQLPPLPDEIITTRCIKFYERLKFPWSHVNQSISLFYICQRKRQVPRRRKRFAAITALIITATAVAASTALGLAVSNRVDHENLRQRVVKFEKVMEHNFRMVDDTVDGTLDVSEAINICGSPRLTRLCKNLLTDSSDIRKIAKWRGLRSTKHTDSKTL